MRGDDGIMPLFCPTEQMAFVKSAVVGRQAIDIAVTGYCAWGCFSSFLLCGSQEPRRA